MARTNQMCENSHRVSGKQCENPHISWRVANPLHLRQGDQMDDHSNPEHRAEADRFDRVLAFLQRAARLKDTLRSGRTGDGKRRGP